MRIVVDGHSFLAPTAFLRILGAGVIDENLPHHVRCHTEKMNAITDVGWSLTHQTGVELMHERSWLKRVTLALFAQMPSRDPAQFRVDQRKQLIKSGSIAIGVLVHKHRNGGVRCHELGIFLSSAGGYLRPHWYCPTLTGVAGTYCT